MPESPLWLLGRNKADAALKSLMTLRGATSAQCVEKEFSEMRASMSLKSAKCSWNTTINNLSKPEAYKPLIIMNMFYLFQQLSGVTIIITYGVSIAKLLLLGLYKFDKFYSHVINKFVSHEYVIGRSGTIVYVMASINPIRKSLLIFNYDINTQTIVKDLQKEQVESQIRRFKIVLSTSNALLYSYKLRIGCKFTNELFPKTS